MTTLWQRSVWSAASGLLVLLAVACSRPGSESYPRLALGRLEEHLLPAGRTDVYEIAVTPGQFLQIAAAGLSGKYQLRLLAPDGSLVAAVSSLKDSEAALRIAAESTTSGAFRVEVAGTGPPATPERRYQLLLERLRRRAAGDEKLVAAYALVCDVVMAVVTAQENSNTKEIIQAARQTLEPAVSTFAALGDPIGEAHALDLLAEFYFALGDSKQTLAAAEASLAAWRRTGRRREEGRALSRVGFAAYVAYDKERSHSSYLAALPIHEEVRDLDGVAATTRRMGWYYRWIGDRPRAIAEYDRALAIFRRLQDRDSEISTLSDRGQVYIEIGDVQSGMKDLEAASRILEQTKAVARTVTVSRTLAMAYRRVGDFERAIQLDQRSLDAAVASGDKRAQSAAHYNLALNYQILGQFAEQKHHLEAALPLTREMATTNGEANILLHLSRAYTEAGQLDRAQQLAEQSLALSESAHLSLEKARALVELSEVAWRRNDGRRALVLAERSYRLAVKIKSMRDQQSALYIWSRICRSVGDHRRATELAARGRQLAAQQRDVHDEAMFLVELARVNLATGNRASALEQIDAALQLFESVRQRLVRYDLRSSYVAEAREHYAIHLDALLLGPAEARTGKRAARALEVNERARARGLLDLLRDSRVDVRADAPKALVEREGLLTQNVRFAASELDQLKQRAANETRLAEASQQLTTLVAQLEEVQAQLRAASPRYAALTQFQPLSAAAIQRELRADGTLLLEYATGAERSWLIAATRDKVRAFELPARRTIETVAQAFSEAIRARQIRVNEPSSARQLRIARADQQVDALSQQLSEMLLGAVASAFPEEWPSARLLIVCSGALPYVPFAALPEPQPRRSASLSPGPPLVAAHELVSLPSASVLAAARADAAARKPGDLGLIVVADPVFDKSDPRLAAPNRAGSPTENRFGRLLFSREEAEQIAKLGTADVVSRLTDFDASLEKVTSGELGRYQMIHLATHGVLDNEHPELSGLVLSQLDREGRPVDGFLRLNQIYNLKLHADLVVLSACETALGSEVKGEGLVGLTRGFMYAGTRRIVASLWKIDDVATSELMKRFYRGLLTEHRGVAEALRLAQNEMRRDDRWKAPYFWAGFTLQGD